MVVLQGTPVNKDMVEPLATPLSKVMVVHQATLVSKVLPLHHMAAALQELTPLCGTGLSQSIVIDQDK